MKRHHQLETALFADLVAFSSKVGYPGGPPTHAAAQQLAQARHEIRLARFRALDAPAIDAAEAKRERRRRRNLAIVASATMCITAST